MSHPEDCSYDTDALAEAHAHTLHNRAEIVQSQNVRCICCLATMPADTVTDYITDGENGFIISKNSVELREKLRQLYEEPQLYRRLAQEGRCQVL